MSDQFQAIRQVFTTMRQEKARHRDIAEKLNISEGELIAAHVGVTESRLQAVRLNDDFSSLIGALEPVGDVLALTRNASCVHEKTGTYRKVSRNGGVGLALGEIDLRIFYSQWVHGFAVTETNDDAQQQSLQFYDKSGTAIHKIFLKPQSDKAAFDALVTQYTGDNQSTGITTLPASPAPAETPDAQIDVAGFKQAWANLKDTHEFFGVLKQFNVSRLQSMRLGDKEFVQQVPTTTVRTLLEAAAAQSVSIMVFVGNPGMIQIHSGPVEKIAVMGPWVNVLDPRFNLHLREDHIASAWVVKKPTEDGLVTSLELFDADGQTIAMFFGERKPGKPELTSWRALIDQLQKEQATCNV